VFLLPGGSSQHSVTTAVGNFAELLYIYVHQFARRVVLVAAHRPASRPVRHANRGNR
jgi:hypothetical protein